MKVVNFNLKNYKSFYQLPDSALTTGFNVIVGENNVGKTALVEGLSLNFSDEPHRSSKTILRLGMRPENPLSWVRLSIELSKDELFDIGIGLGDFFLNTPAKNDTNYQPTLNKFFDTVSQDKVTITCIYQQSKFNSVFLEGYDFSDEAYASVYRINRNTRQFEDISGGTTVSIGGALSNLFLRRVAETLRTRIYRFSAERLNVSEAPLDQSETLLSDASNLAQVLHTLQTTNSYRYERFNRAVSKVLPQVKWIDVLSIGNNRGRIRVWTIDRKTERTDLAVELSKSGTGIGQVLAILYVALNADYPRTIIIDEPQSFLHPGAIRKLFDILKNDVQQQHQYILTTHSPTVIAAADPHTILKVRIDDEQEQSVIDTIAQDDINQLNSLLSEVGAQLSDVFGVDNILWLEGETEKTCFPLILRQYKIRPPSGTKMLSVLHTGDFQSKDAERVFRIYTRLSEGMGLLPPALGFIFDREGLTKTQQADLQRQSKAANFGKDNVFFLRRRLYENYLLNPRAIAAVVSNIEGFRDTSVTEAEIKDWIAECGWKPKYFPDGVPELRTEETWFTEVHGADLLKDMFNHFSQARVSYDKRIYGEELTDWILKNSPSDLKPIADLIEQALPPKEQYLFK